MSVIPGLLLTETVTVEPYTGIGPAGPAFATAVTVRAHVQETADLDAADRGGLVGAARVATRTAGCRIWIRPGLTVPAGSRVTARAATFTATKVAVHDGRGLPVPSHIELRCETTAVIPDTTVTILRGIPAEDAYGDLVDTPTVIATAVPAGIVEERQASSEPVEQRRGVVETYNIRLPPTVDVREGDRIRDDRTTHLYRVLDVTYPHTSTGPQLGTDDVMVTARRVAATSAPPG